MTGLERRTPLRKVGKRGRARRTGMTASTPALVERSGGWCEAHLPGCEGRATQRHHRLRGDDTDRSLVHLCRACHHDTIHAQPSWSYRHGWLIHSGQDIWPAVRCRLECTVDHRPGWDVVA